MRAKSKVGHKGASKKVGHTVGTSKSEVGNGKVCEVNGAPAAGYYLGDRKLDEFVGGFCRASRDRAGRSFAILLEEAAELDRVICELDGGRFEGLKRGQNRDPYVVVAEHPDSRYCDKQARRIHGLHKAVEAFRTLNERPPEVGVTKYAVTEPLKCVRDRLALLRRAEAEKMSVRDLARAVEEKLDEEDQGKGKAKRAQRKEQSLRQEFRKFAWGATKELFDFSARLKKSGRSLGDEDVLALQKLRSAIDDILGEVK